MSSPVASKTSTSAKPATTSSSAACLPFAGTAPDTAEAILEQLFAALRPRGRLSFFAYAGLPTLHAAVSGPARRRRLALTRHIVRGFVAQYGVERTLVTGNIPPAWVHHLTAEPVRRTAR